MPTLVGRHARCHIRSQPGRRGSLRQRFWNEQVDYIQDEFTDYIICAIYGPTGMSASTCDLPNVVSFQTVTPDTLYALNLNQIVSLGMGAVIWASGDAVAGNHVVFATRV